MKVQLDKAADPANKLESPRPELGRYQRELDSFRERMRELEQAETLLAGENRLLEMVAKGEALHSILDGICRLVEEISSGSLCSILFLDDNRLLHGAAPSLPASYTDAVDGWAIGPTSGPCGRATYLRKQVIVPDIAADPLGDEYRDLALAHGVKACWSTPIFSSEGRVLGSFAVLSREPRSPTPQDEKIIAQVTHLAAVAIERQRTEQELRREKKLLEMIARGNALPSVLEELCRFGEEMSGNVLVSILLVSPDGKSLRHGAAPSLPKSYTQAIDGGLIGPHSGSCGTAAYQRERVIVSDIATDPLWDQYRDLALKQGFRACWSTPFFSTTRDVMGTFALYSREPGSPTSGQLNLIEQMTHLAAVAVERQRSEEALRSSESRFEGILAIAEDAIISIDSNQRILLFNQGAERVFGYDKREVIGKPLDALLPQRFAHAHRTHVEEFAGSPDVARVMGQRREVFGLRKGGQEFPAEASISKLDLGGELVFTVILRDITERKRAAEALHASEQLARGQVEALTRTLDALAMESVPDRLAEHVLRTITEQLNAHSSSVWKRDETGDLMIFEFAFEGGRLVTKSDSVIGAASTSLPIKGSWPGSEVFFTGKPRVLEDIRTGQAFPWRDHLLAQGVITILVVPMLVAGRVAGVIGIRFTRQRLFRPEEMELAQALANQAMLAIQLTRLSAQGRQSAVMAERNRMARDIHDTLAQGFTGVIMQLEAVKGAIAQKDLAEARDRVERAGDLARVGLGEARRSVLALRPRSLQNHTLCMALDDLLRRMTNGSGLQAEFHLEGDEPVMPADWEEGLLRVAQESLTNTIKHAKARNFRATLMIDAKEIQFRLVDDGVGFDLQAEHEGFGLLGMKERVEQMGGQFILRSMPGQGTEIQILLHRTTKQEPSLGGEHA